MINPVPSDSCRTACNDWVTRQWPGGRRRLGRSQRSTIWRARNSGSPLAVLTRRASSTVVLLCLIVATAADLACRGRALRLRTPTRGAPSQTRPGRRATRVRRNGGTETECNGADFETVADVGARRVDCKHTQKRRGEPLYVCNNSRPATASALK